MSAPLSLDVAIVGGGTAGCAAALHLARAGMRVGLFERRTAGSQASGVNYGGVREQGRDLAELPLSRRARAVWDRLPALVGSDCEFEATGHLKLARSEDEMADLERFATGAAAHGLAVELLSGNALRDRFPWLGPAVFGGSLCPSDGQANPRLVAPSFARAARAAGALLHEHEPVTGATRGAEGFHLETAAGRRVRAGQLVNVAGAWGPQVAAWFGEALPVEPISPNMQVSEPLPHRLRLNLGVVGGGIYARQIARGNLIFGGGQGRNDFAAIRARAGEAVTLAAQERLVEILPWARGAQVIRTWSGIEGYTPDGIPVIGPSLTTPGLWHAFGFSGHGFQLGPGMGEILAELVTGGATATPLDPFSAARFGRGDPPRSGAAPDGRPPAATPTQQQGERT